MLQVHVALLMSCGTMEPKTYIELVLKGWYESNICFYKISIEINLCIKF